MKVKELRIGNWVTIKNYVDFDWERRPKECQVNMFDMNGYIAYHWNGTGEEYYYKLIDCEPILLTEEWLIKFGFENNRLGLFDCIKVVEDIGFHIYFIQRHLKEVQYVHQLQNLYFALTGEELTFKSE